MTGAGDAALEPVGVTRPHGDRSAAFPARRAAVVALDLEMTGLDVLRDRICEIGVVVADVDGDTEWASTVRPDVPVTAEAAALHGLDADALADAPPFDDVAPALLALLAGRCGLAHGAVHDLAFLDGALARAGRRRPDGPWVDTLVLARRALSLDSHKLGDLCRALGVPRGRAHRALDDARATLGVWRALVALLDPDDLLDVEGVVALAERLGRRSELRREQVGALRAALAARRSVDVVYLSADDDGVLRRSERRLDVWRVSSPRVQGWCHLRGAERVFRLDRILSVTATDVGYDLPSFQARI